MDNQSNTKSNSASSVLQEISEVLAKMESAGVQSPWRIEFDSNGNRLIVSGEPDDDSPLMWGIAVGAEGPSDVPAPVCDFIIAAERLLRHAQAEIEGLQDRLGTMEGAYALANHHREAAEARAEAAEGRERELLTFAKDVAGWSLLMLSPEAQYAGIKRARELVAREGTTPPTTKMRVPYDKDGLPGCLPDNHAWDGNQPGDDALCICGRKLWRDRGIVLAAERTEGTRE